MLAPLVSESEITCYLLQYRGSSVISCSVLEPLLSSVVSGISCYHLDVRDSLLHVSFCVPDALPSLVVITCFSCSVRDPLLSFAVSGIPCYLLWFLGAPAFFCRVRDQSLHPVVLGISYVMSCCVRDPLLSPVVARITLLSLLVSGSFAISRSFRVHLQPLVGSWIPFSFLKCQGSPYCHL